jgi:hypothetical protein
MTIALLVDDGFTDTKDRAFSVKIYVSEIELVCLVPDGSKGRMLFTIDEWRQINAFVEAEIAPLKIDGDA